MRFLISRQIPLLIVAAIAAVCPLAAQQKSASISGAITDQSGASVPGAELVLTGKAGAAINVSSDASGKYFITNLSSGNYTLSVTHSGFASIESQQVTLTAGRNERLDLALKLKVLSQEVTVNERQSDALSVDSSANASALVLTGKDLEALPDDPDDLAQDLKALAGPSAGPNGGQFFVDGFSGGHLPPKSSIREIRINQNPFSAEFEKVGMGRVEIFTKPGSDKIHGTASLKASDALFNSRNPFLMQKPPYRSMQSAVDLSGPLSKRASFFLNFEERQADDNAVINANILGPGLVPTALSQFVPVPQTNTIFTPRADYQLTDTNTLVARYSWQRSVEKNAGVGTFSLPTRGYRTATLSQAIHLTDTAVLGVNAVNETRFQYERSANTIASSDFGPSLVVLDSFNGGGGPLGNSAGYHDNYELQNYTSITSGTHATKFGAVVRSLTFDSVSRKNFNGVFTFGGGLAPELNSANQLILDPSGSPILSPISSLERYRRTVLALPGGGASQFTLSAGHPETSFSVAEMGLFFQHDWRIRPGLSVNFGLRSELQTGIGARLDLAPRFGFAWDPQAGHRGDGKTVIRGGSGIFFDRIGEDLLLQSRRFDGTTEQQYILSNPGFFPEVPSAASLAILHLPQTIQTIDSSIRAPYLIQNAIGIERRLPFKFVISTTFLNSRGVHQLRSRNINAPFAGSGARPFGAGNIFNLESDGVLNQNQLITNVSRRFSRGFSLFGYYAYGRAFTNTDGPASFPSNTYNLGQDYGRAITDIRHRAVVGGSMVAPFRLSFSPFLVAQSGTPFDITTGRDSNRDAVFNDRPAFAADPSQPRAVRTIYGVFDLNPRPGEKLIPRNLGVSNPYLTMNLRLSRSFGFGGAKESSGGTPGKSKRDDSINSSSDHSFHGMFHDVSSPQRFNATLSITARNLFNNVNNGVPVGNLSSPYFGRSNWLASASNPSGSASSNNRRILFQLRFDF